MKRKEGSRTSCSKRIKVTNWLSEVKGRGKSNEWDYIKEVRRRDGRNEMNDVTANGRKELKRKEVTNRGSVKTKGRKEQTK